MNNLGLFTLIFGVLARTEKFNYIKCAGVLVSLFGVIFVSTADHNSSDDMGNSPILGNNTIAFNIYSLMCIDRLLNKFITITYIR